MNAANDADARFTGCRQIQHGLRLGHLAGGGHGGPAVRLRLGGDRRGEAVFREVLRISQRSSGRVGEQLCTSRLPARIADLRRVERPVRPQAAAADIGGVVYRLIHPDRLGPRVSLVYRLADHRRCRHRHGLQPVAHVHRRGGAGARARPPGGAQPAYHRDRHSGRTGGQLADCRIRCRTGRRQG